MQNLTKPSMEVKKVYKKKVKQKKQSMEQEASGLRTSTDRKRQGENTHTGKQ